MYDIQSILKQYSIPYKIETKGWVNVDCPLCHHQGTRGYKGGFNVKYGYYNCWTCGGSNIFFVISKLLSISQYEAKSLLNNHRTNTVYNDSGITRDNVEELTLPGEFPITDKFRNYLIKRRYDPDYIQEKYKVHSGGIVGEHSFRLIIPIYFHTQLVSYQTRSILSKEKCNELGILRYKTLSEEKSVINPKHILYEIDNCKGDTVVIVEGVFDQWRLGDGVVATLGTGMKEQQIKLLKERFKKAIFLYDNEKEAQDRAIKYGERLSVLGMKVEVYNPGFQHDPGAYTEKEENIVKKELNLIKR